MGRDQVTVGERVQQTRKLLRAEGARGISNRLRRRGAALLAPPATEPNRVSLDDLRGAAAAVADPRGLPRPLPWHEGRPLDIAWVDEPPSRGSGGQTTIFRMIEELEALGHRCTLYLLDRHGWDIEQHRATVARVWPQVRAEVHDVRDGIADSHAVLATCWESVYPVLASPAAGARMYFVQDYEPLFYAAGSNSMLAEATYRFGLHGITAGRWLAQKVAAEHGMTADHFDFGCDTATYRLDTSPGAERRRDSVSYYCRPATARRAHELAMAALELFAEQRPDVPIHLYGQRLPSLPFRATQHGLLTPAELDALYNRSIAGLTLSATNVSLVPHEMLSSGCIPVVNDAEQNRVVLDNDLVRYAGAAPFDLAAALVELCDRPPTERAARARAAAQSVSGSSWSDAGRQVERSVRQVVLAGQRAAVG
jgi:O-antigen biosynthesis protein